MKTIRSLLPAMTAVALGLAAGCSTDWMSMADELDRLETHRVALQADLTRHHADVLQAGDPAAARSFETGFGRTSLGHMTEMEHGMRDMQGMCMMHGRGFDVGPMSTAMNGVRAGLDEHQRRMAGAADMAGLRSEESAFRDRMAALMDEMRHRQSDARAGAAGYTCRMHGH